MRPSLNLPSTLISSCELSLTSVPLIVLDTNAVLDWLLFADPSMALVAAAIANGHVQWIATAAMRDEFSHVLSRGLAAARGADPTRLQPHWRQRCSEHPTAPPSPKHLRCTDADDQKFLDLALATGARWLISRDRALLKLHRRASAHKLVIVTPAQWRFE
jgi:predicted nucleic acid-binding protein